MKKLIIAIAALSATPAFAGTYGPPDPAVEEQKSLDRMRGQSSYRIEADETEVQAAKRYDGVRKSARRWETAYQVLNVADMAQTCYVIETGRGREKNPFLPKTCGGIVAVKSLWGAMHYIVFNQTLKHNPHAALRGAKISTFIQGAVVGANFRVVL